MNRYRLPALCNGCNQLLLLENLYVDDGCPCNTRRGVNLAPQKCAACKVDDCVKPGHRLPEIYGDVAASSTAVSLNDNASAILLLERALISSRT